MSDDPISYAGEEKYMKPEDLVAKKTIVLTKAQLDELAEGKNGALTEESEITGSESWAGDMKQVILHLPTIMSTYGMFELVIRAGKPWLVRRFVTVHEVLFPDGEMEIKNSPEKKA